MRELWIAGNWKMYKTRAEARAWVAALIEHPQAATVHLMAFASATLLATVEETAKGRIWVGAQNLHPGREGAFTGELSARQLLDAGATAVLIGHSERRHLFHEDDELLQKKVRTALDSGLRPMYCIGETLAERQGGRTEEVLDRQLTRGLAGVGAEEWSRLWVAYEPVWAIGTGETATPAMAQAAHRFTRDRLQALGGEAAARVPILYGGSVKPENAGELLSQPDIEGVLVGGASLEAGSFAAIAAAGAERQKTS